MLPALFSYHQYFVISLLNFFERINLCLFGYHQKTQVVLYDFKGNIMNKIWALIKTMVTKFKTQAYETAQQRLSDSITEIHELVFIDNNQDEIDKTLTNLILKGITKYKQSKKWKSKSNSLEWKLKNCNSIEEFYHVLKAYDENSPVFGLILQQIIDVFSAKYQKLTERQRHQYNFNRFIFCHKNRDMCIFTDVSACYEDIMMREIEGTLYFGSASKPPIFVSTRDYLFVLLASVAHLSLKPSFESTAAIGIPSNEPHSNVSELPLAHYA